MAFASINQASVGGGSSNALAIQSDGIFMPRLSTGQRTALALTAGDTGLTVYDFTLNNLFIWNGTAWESIPGSGDAGANGSVQYNDNGIVSGATNFVYNKVNQKVGIGTVTPNVELDVVGSATITGDLTVDTSTLKVDSTNNRVGIGTATPGAGFGLDVASGIAIRSGNILGVFNSDNTAGFQIYNNGATGATNSTCVFLSGAVGVRATLDASGNFNVANGNLIIGTSGKGIDFGVTASGSGTMTSELLNDYEEGTWTIGLTFGGASTGMITSSNSGTYTKVGRKVTLNGYIALSNKGTATGAALITGLPFTLGSANNNYSAVSLYIASISFADYPMGYGNINTTNIILQEVTNAGVRSNLTEADFANNSEIIFSLTYSV